MHIRITQVDKLGNPTHTQEIPEFEPVEFLDYLLDCAEIAHTIDKLREYLDGGGRFENKSFVFVRKEFPTTHLVDVLSLGDDISEEELLFFFDMLLSARVAFPSENILH